jgi:DNA polymerase-3 subunit gamma/tau
MEHLALYRELRPQLFSEVIGQDAVCRTLKNSVRSGRLLHAYLFCGPRGTGKTSTARILAKAINCASPRDGEPCNDCESCQAITAGNAVDVLEMDAASNRGIDEIRDLKERVGYVPVGNCRIYIIDEVHMLTGEAFNALLKTLEEPPAHSVFILATTEAHKVPPTVSSRCQRFEFRRLGHDLIRCHLAGIATVKDWTVEPDALDILARQAGGALRDAVGLLDQAASFTQGKIGLADALSITGSINGETLSGILETAVAGDAPALVVRLGEVLTKGHEPRQILFQLIEHVRGELFSGRGRAPDQYAALLRSLACADTEMRGSSRPDLVLEVALLRVAGFPESQSAGPVEPKERPAASPLAGKTVACDKCGKKGSTHAHDGIRVPDIGHPLGAENRPAAAPAASGIGGNGGQKAAFPEAGQPAATIGRPAGAAEADGVDLPRLKLVMANHLVRHRILQQALRACSNWLIDGGKIIIFAPQSYLNLLQRPENMRLLNEGAQACGWRLPVEVVSVECESKKAEAPGDEVFCPPPPGADVVDYAMQVFKGTLVSAGKRVEQT